MSLEKIQSVLSWPAPTRSSISKGFWGISNVYCRFAPGFWRIILPPSVNLKKDAVFCWTPSRQRAFKELKSIFISLLVLQHFNSDRSTRVEIDASDAAFSAVLSQLAPTDQRWHPVAYHSHKLIPAELNYTVSEKEILAIFDAVHVWRHYVEGVNVVQVLTDHQSIASFHKPQLLSRRQSR